VNNKIAVKNAKLELILNMLIKEVVIDVNLCIVQEILVNAQVWMFLNLKCLTFLNKIYYNKKSCLMPNSIHRLRRIIYIYSKPGYANFPVFLLGIFLIVLVYVIIKEISKISDKKVLRLKN